MKGQAELRDADTEVELHQNKRPLFPVPDMDAAEKPREIAPAREELCSKVPLTQVVPEWGLFPVFAARCRGAGCDCGGVAVFAFP